MASIENLWLVDFDRAAATELKSLADHKAALSVIDKLESLGPRLSSPHMKSLKGQADLFELRPRQGACAVRLIYVREGRRFVVLATAPDKASFDRGVGRARVRLSRRRRSR